MAFIKQTNLFSKEQLSKEPNRLIKKEQFYQAKKDLINPSFLISPKYLKQTKSSLQGQDLKIWFSSKRGRFQVEGGDYPTQTISTKALKETLINRITGSLNQVNRWTTLNIRRTLSESKADIKVYYDKIIKLGGEKNFLGIAAFNKSNNKNFWEIFLNAKKIKSPNQLIYTALHEIGHAVGLEHPHDIQDNDFYAKDGLINKGTPQQTVMSTQYNTNEIYPEEYQYNDLNALQKAWGVNPKKSSISNYLFKPLRPKLFSDKIIKFDATAEEKLTIKGKSSPQTKLSLIIGEEIKNINANREGGFRITFSPKQLKELSYYPGLEIFLEQEDYNGNILNSKSYMLMQAAT